MPDESSPSDLPDLSDISEVPEESSFTGDPTWAGSCGSSGKTLAPLSDEHRAVEAVVLSAVEPVPPTLLAELLEMPVERVETVCEELAREYQLERRGFVLARIAGGYRYQTHPDMAAFVERYAMEGISARLSSAALETLAIVAYRQPISRGQISALRGVNVDGVVRLLEQRGYIEAVGVAPGPGQPTLYGTTNVFLEKLGLNDLSQLPRIEELLPGPEVMQQLEEQVRPSAGA
jgi:segregation and condensation protein B